MFKANQLQSLGNWNMSFINESIPPEDFKKYNFENLNKRPCQGLEPAFDWTIDRHEKIWLRNSCVQANHTELHGGYTGIIFWDFFWKSAVFFVKTKTLDAKGLGVNEDFWTRYKLLDINIPMTLEKHRNQILKDLQKALEAHAAGGVYSRAASSSVALEL